MIYRKLIVRSLGVLELLIGVGAVLGGAALTVTPSGALLRMPLEILHGSPFHTFLIPGLLLCFAVGGSNVVAGWLALRESRATAISAVIAGGVLVGWMTTQIVLLGYRHPVQLLYLLGGIATLLTGVVLAALRRNWLAETGL